MVACALDDGDGEKDIAQSHDYESALDCALVVLAAVGDDASDKAQNVDCSIEYRIDDSCRPLAKPEFRAEEQQEHGIHDIVAEALAHVAERRGYESFWMPFEHIARWLVLWVLFLLGFFDDGLFAEPVGELAENLLLHDSRHVADT